MYTQQQGWGANQALQGMDASGQLMGGAGAPYLPAPYFSPEAFGGGPFGGAFPHGPSGSYPQAGSPYGYGLAGYGMRAPPGMTPPSNFGQFPDASAMGPGGPQGFPGAGMSGMLNPQSAYNMYNPEMWRQMMMMMHPQAQMFQGSGDGNQQPPQQQADGNMQHSGGQMGMRQSELQDPRLSGSQSPQADRSGADAQQQQQDMGRQGSGMDSMGMGRGGPGAVAPPVDAAMMMLMAQGALGGAHPFQMALGLHALPQEAMSAAAAAAAAGMGMGMGIGMGLPGGGPPIKVEPNRGGPPAALPMMVPPGFAMNAAPVPGLLQDLKGDGRRGGSAPLGMVPNAGLPTMPAPVGLLQSSMGMDDDEETEEEEEGDCKKMKRKQSNRESARRSRLRKQAELTDVAKEVDVLERGNVALERTLHSTQAAVEQLAATNAVLADLAAHVRARGGNAASIPPEELQPFYVRLLALRDNLITPHQALGTLDEAPSALVTAPAQQGKQATDPTSPQGHSSRSARKPSAIGATSAAVEAPAAAAAQPAQQQAQVQPPTQVQVQHQSPQLPPPRSSPTAQPLHGNTAAAPPWAQPAGGVKPADMVGRQKAAAAAEAMARATAAAADTGAHRSSKRAEAAGGAEVEGSPDGGTPAKRQRTSAGSRHAEGAVEQVAASHGTDKERCSPMTEHILQLKQRGAGMGGGVAAGQPNRGGTGGNGAPHGQDGQQHAPMRHVHSGSCSSPNGSSGSQSSSSFDSSSSGSQGGDRSGGDGQSESRGVSPLHANKAAGGAAGSSGGAERHPTDGPTTTTGGGVVGVADGGPRDGNSGNDKSSEDPGQEQEQVGGSVRPRGAGAGSGSDIDWSNMLQQEESAKQDETSSDPLFKMGDGSVDMAGDMGGMGMGLALTSNVPGGSEANYTGTPDGSVQLGSASHPVGSHAATNTNSAVLPHLAQLTAGGQGRTGGSGPVGPGAPGVSARHAALLGLSRQGLLPPGEAQVVNLGGSAGSTGSEGGVCAGGEGGGNLKGLGQGQSPGQWLVE